MSTKPKAATNVPVLMYHRVDMHQHDKDMLCVSPGQFESHLDWLAMNDYQPCSAADFEAWFANGKALPERSVLITFDDGYASLHEHALAQLAVRGWPATVFLVSELIGRHDEWRPITPDSPKRLPLLGRAHIAEMARHGFDFQSHSRTHADLPTLADDALRTQILSSREDLQALLGTAVHYFAYPFGRFDERVQRAVDAAGYRLAFSVRSGFNHAGVDRLALRRLDITRLDSRARFGRKVSLGTNDGSLSAHWRYLAGRLRARLTP